MSALLDRFEQLIRENDFFERRLREGAIREEALKNELHEIKSDLNDKLAQYNKLEELVDKQTSIIKFLESQLEMVGGKPTGSF